MELRCKPGDLVVLVSDNGVPNVPPRVGAIFNVTSISEHFPEYSAWNTDPEFIDPADGLRVVVPDRLCRPINDGPGDDETLSWAGKPAPVIRELSEPEFDAACDRWIQGVEA